MPLARYLRGKRRIPVYADTVATYRQRRLTMFDEMRQLKRQKIHLSWNISSWMKA